MEIEAKLIEKGFDYSTLDHTLTFKLPHSFDEDELNTFITRNLNKTLTIKEPTTKRSLDANAYCWVLLQKIAERIGSDKWSVYIEEIKKYSRVFTHICCREEAIPKIAEEFRAYEIVGDISIGSGIGKQIRVYYGSSTFTKEEMQVFLNGVVSDAKELGIKTLEDLELERIVSEWS